MKAVMTNIRPKWCKLIASGKKTIEVRKTRAKIDVPFKCYIYKTKKRILRYVIRKGEENWYGDIADKTEIISYPDIDGGKVIGEFVCDRIDLIECDSEVYKSLEKETCLSYTQFADYCNGNDLYGWHISNLVIYDKPKELSEFKYQCKTYIKGLDECLAEDSCGCYENGDCRNGITKFIKPPQSWCYVEELEEDKCKS